MLDNKLHLGYSSLSEKIYLGRQRNGLWQGEKRDVTSEFLQVMEHKFPMNTHQVISVGGVDSYRVIVVDMDKEVVVNGKKL
jgi:hypothetical protein